MRVKVTLDFAESGGVLDYINTSMQNNNGSRNPFQDSVIIHDGVTDMEYNNGMEVISLNGINTIGNHSGKMINIGGYNGYMWGLSGATRQNSIILTISGSSLGKVGFVFDREAGQYPHKYILTTGGETTEFTNDFEDPYEIEVLLGASSAEQTLEFTEWERPNYQMCLTFIESHPSFEVFTDSEVDNIDTTIEASNNSATINYGCLANMGNVVIRDKISATGKNKIWEYAQLGYLNLNRFSLNVEMFNGNISHHISTDTPYYDSNQTFTINLTDRIYVWSDIICEPTTYIQQTTLYNVLFDTLNSYIPRESAKTLQKMSTQKIVIGNNDDNSELTQSEAFITGYLKDIIIPPFSFGEESLVSRLNKICVVAQLYCYFDENNILSFITARPKATADEIENRLIVGYGDQYNEVVSTILVANAYDNVIIK